MTIQEFAERYRVHVRKDGAGDEIIPGFHAAKDMPKRVKDTARTEYRNHIYDNGNGQFGVCLLFTTSARKTYAAARLAEAGFTLRQVGHSECTALFNPANDSQAKVALAECQINAIWVLSAAQQQVLERLKATRQPPLFALMGAEA